MDQSKIAIFIDVENLTQWIKDDGPEKLLSDLSSTGQIIVRRAYGKWTNPALLGFQSILNRLGFELIHNFHPVSGKNSTDIQLTIDAMEYAMRLSDVNWFVLATGDSDFSPLFRRLREMGKDVIGVGPRSPLSESVKTSCSKYIYTDLDKETIKKSAFDDAVELVEKALSTFEGPAALGALKNVMTNLDSAFDEKGLGFKSFRDFLGVIETVKLESGKDKTAWFAIPASLENSEIKSDEFHPAPDLQPESIITFQNTLKNKNWPFSPKTHLIKVYQALLNLPPKTKKELTEAVIEKLDDRQITSTDVKRAISVLWKAKLFTIVSSNNGESEDKLWRINNKPDYIKDVDSALLSRLFSSCQEKNIKIDLNAIKQLLYGRYSTPELNLMLDKAVNNSQEFEKQRLLAPSQK